MEDAVEDHERCFRYELPNEDTFDVGLLSQCNVDEELEIILDDINIEDLEFEGMEEIISLPKISVFFLLF